MTEMAEVLRKSGFEVRLLLGSGSGKEEATRANIESSLKELLR